MNTRPYSDLYGLVEALCGCTFAAQEAVRVKYFINRRAQKAYAESEYWPRFYVVGEERIVSEDGLLPYEQTGLSDIGTVLRIHASEPMKTRFAAEYGDFYAASGGIQITGYSASEVTDGADMLITGTENPDINGRYRVSGTQTGQNGGEASVYTSLSNTNYQIFPQLQSSGGLDFVGWILGNYADPDYWIQADYPVLLSTTPSPAGLTYTETGSASGTAVVTEDAVYSAYITYKAALSATYGDEDGDTSDVPEEWFEYMAHGAYSDFLRNDQQQDRAALAEQEANEILMAQLEKIGRQNGSSAFTRIVTPGNSQWR